MTSFNQCKNTRNREAGHRVKLNPLFDITLRDALINAELSENEHIIGDWFSNVFTLSPENSEKLMAMREELSIKDNDGARVPLSEILEATKKDIMRFVIVRKFPQERKNGNISVNRIAYDKLGRCFKLALDTLKPTDF